MNKPIQNLLSLGVIIFISSWGSDTVTQASTTQGQTIPSSTSYSATTYSPALARVGINDECINSFQTFAYDGPSERNFDTTLPLAPWQIEANIPVSESESDWTSFIFPQMSRSINGHQEIWLTMNTLAIYYPESQEWEMISRMIGDTEMFVSGIFVTQDGTVWSGVGWNTSQEHPDRETVPVLSRFNESTRRFELVQDVLEIPMVLDPGYFNWTKIVLDNHDIFWIFVENDGLYRYDPTTQTTEKRADLPSFQVSYTALSPDGSIYFQKYRWGGATLYRLPEDTLFQYFPETNEIELLDIPNEEWPIFSGMLVDHTGGLWLGSIGYREADGIWHLTHPHPEEYFDHLGDYLWAPANLIFESSDGRLWYNRYLDTGGWNEGTAWYDPQTGEGCLFTNQNATIVEDSEQQLWLAAGGTLYKYSLNT